MNTDSDFCTASVFDEEGEEEEEEKESESISE